MILNIQNIKDAGVIEKERIILSVNHSGDVGNCLIAVSRKRDENSISARLEHIYWIPNQLVKENDLIVIYTKKGKRNQITNNDGSTTFFFYWGLTESIAQDDFALVLFDSQWNYRLVSEAKREDDNTKYETL